jgi:hypothetical protein
MRRLRVPRKTAIALAVLVMALTVPRIGQPTLPAGGSGASAATAAAPAEHPQATTAPKAIAARTVADVTPAVATTGGLCSVWGIGDIAGLFGFCSLGQSGLIGDLNNICEPSLPDPEPANAGIDAMIAPPAGGKQPSTLYDQYGVAGDYWAATNLQCSDMTSLIGNNVAGMVFDVAKSIDRVTITVYQAAAGEGILSWLSRAADRLISGLGNAIYFPYLAVVVILGAMWLAWQGLIRKRATRTIEGTIWMVVACAAAIVLIGKPADVTGLGQGVSDGMSQALNTAFAKLPSPGATSCVPLSKGDPQSQPVTYSYTSGNTVVDQNADELWTVLVCKPWLDGEFGTSVYSTHGAPTAVNTYARSLLWAQAIATNETPSAALIQAKQATFAGIASSIQSKDPAAYPLFQGKEWTTRLEIAFAALFAAVVAGVLVLLISLTLILLKLGFLLLLIAGPFFLLVGTHPGFGRVLAMRWLELLVGVLLKQAAVAVVLSVLLYCYALIMGTSDQVLPWALKIIMIALVTVAAFIYRKPFQHLFSAVGYGVIGSHEQAAADLQRAGATARANTVGAATMALPPFAAYRAARWARRNPAQAASLAMGVASGVGAGTTAGAAVAAGMGNAEPGAEGMADAAAAGGADGALARATIAGRARALAGQTGGAGAGGQSAAEPPPLNLPSRNGGSVPDANGAVAAASGGPARAAWPGSPLTHARQSSLASAAAGAASSGTVTSGTMSSGPVSSPVSSSTVSSGAPSPGASASGAPSLGAPLLGTPPSGVRTAWPGTAAGAASGSGSAATPPASSAPPRRAAPPRAAPSRTAPPRTAPPRPGQPRSAQPPAPQPAGQRAQGRPSTSGGRPASPGRSASGPGGQQRQPAPRGQGGSQPQQPQQPRQPAARRSGQPPARRPARPARSSAPPVRRPPGGEGQAQDGQQLAGPVPDAPAERSVPFWLRPMRRK